jgi:hypothetical protein
MYWKDLANETPNVGEEVAILLSNGSIHRATTCPLIREGNSVCIFRLYKSDDVIFQENVTHWARLILPGEE